MEPLSANDPRTIGEFRLHSRLGAGGMGQVYLGFSPAGRAVAVKVIHPHFAADPEFLRRFSQEVTAARAVGGMYTAPVVDSSVSDGVPWLATAYVPGPALSAVVAANGPLPETAVWRLAAGLAEALRAVHAAGVIHRDLKPANVLLADDGPHLIDFGIARPFHGTQLTSAGMVIGTPGYMSPEQAGSGPTGPAGDIFSLGCVLAYAATGAAPFSGDNPASVLFRIVSSEPDLSRIPPRLRQVIEACLRKDPAQRPDPGQLITMIRTLGPATPATLGSFWPPEVARVIAAERSESQPGDMGSPGQAKAPAAAGTGGPAGTGAAAPRPGRRTPTVLAAPAGLDANGAGHGTGDAPMLSDGYYAAAQGRAASMPPAPSRPASGASGPTRTAMPSGPSGPSGARQQRPATPAPGAQQYGGSPGNGQPGGPAGSGQPARARYGQQGNGQGPGTPPGSRPPHPEASGAGYVPGSRNPMPAEVPDGVLTAIRLMYAGFAVTALDALLSTRLLVRYLENSSAAKKAAAAAIDPRMKTLRTDQWHAAGALAGSMAVSVTATLLGLVCWIWLAMAARRGHGWTKTAGTVLLCVYSVCTLIVLFRTHDLGPQITSVIVWLTGLAAVIPLWSKQASEFFARWHRD